MEDESSFLVHLAFHQEAQQGKGVQGGNEGTESFALNWRKQFFRQLIFGKPGNKSRPDLFAELCGGGKKEDGVDHELAARKYFIEKEIFWHGGNK